MSSSFEADDDEANDETDDEADDEADDESNDDEDNDEDDDEENDGDAKATPAVGENAWFLGENEATANDAANRKGCEFAFIFRHDLLRDEVNWAGVEYLSLER